jgi:hypothetical protein
MFLVNYPKPRLLKLKAIFNSRIKPAYNEHTGEICKKAGF